MAHSALDLVNSMHAGLLEPGEHYLAAAHADTQPAASGFGLVGMVVATAINSVDRKTNGFAMKEHMTWAATERRLLIWERDRLTTRKPKEFLGSLVLGVETFDPRFGVSKRARDSAYLTIMLWGTKVSLNLPSQTEARALFDAMRSVLPPPPGS